MNNENTERPVVAVAMSPAFRAEIRRALQSGDAGKMSRVLREIEVAADIAEDQRVRRGESTAS